MKVSIAVLGATGYVGQRLLSLLAGHPFFEVKSLIASPRSAGQKYGQVMAERWQLAETAMPEEFADHLIYSLEDLDKAVAGCQLVFSALSLDKEETKRLEEDLARRELIVLSNNSAHRQTPDVPLLIPEINSGHLALLAGQKKRLGTKRGFIIAKPNCSIQSYVPALTPLRPLGLKAVIVSTYQAVSGAGRRLVDWPEMQENMIPYIGGEEAKSEWEPLKIWGEVDTELHLATAPKISAHCCRVSVNEGHTATVSFALEQKVSREDILQRWMDFNQNLPTAGLPSAPDRFIHYVEAEDRPQPKLDVDSGGGMAVTVGRLREDPVFDYKFVCLSHNTLRGAAGGSVLSAEYLYQEGYFQ